MTRLAAIFLALLALIGAQQSAMAKANVAPKTASGNFTANSSLHAPRDTPQTLDRIGENQLHDYETASGRPKWPSRDPIQENGGENLYNFLANDGINWVDYLGLAGVTQSEKDACQKSCDASCKAYERKGIINATEVWTKDPKKPKSKGTRSIDCGCKCDTTGIKKCPDDIKFKKDAGGKYNFDPDGTDWKPSASNPGDYEKDNGKGKKPSTLHPDPDHGDGVKPHWDYRDENGGNSRIFPEGNLGLGIPQGATFPK